jgi:hypothetical protein
MEFLRKKSFFLEFLREREKKCPSLGISTIKNNETTKQKKVSEWTVRIQILYRVLYSLRTSSHRYRGEKILPESCSPPHLFVTVVTKTNVNVNVDFQSETLNLYSILNVHQEFIIYLMYRCIFFLFLIDFPKYVVGQYEVVVIDIHYFSI